MRTLLLASCLSLAACSSREYTLPPLPRVSRADLTGHSAQVLRSIADPAVLAEITAFVEQRRSGWREGFPVTAVPSLHILFYDGDTQVGNFGIGSGFFESMLAMGVWVERSATHSEEQQILELIEMRDYDLNK